MTTREQHKTICRELAHSIMRAYDQTDWGTIFDALPGATRWQLRDLVRDANRLAEMVDTQDMRQAIKRAVKRERRRPVGRHA